MKRKLLFGVFGVLLALFLTGLSAEVLFLIFHGKIYFHYARQLTGTAPTADTELVTRPPESVYYLYQLNEDPKIESFQLDPHNAQITTVVTPFGQGLVFENPSTDLLTATKEIPPLPTTEDLTSYQLLFSCWLKQNNSTTDVTTLSLKDAEKYSYATPLYLSEEWRYVSIVTAPNLDLTDLSFTLTSRASRSEIAGCNLIAQPVRFQPNQAGACRNYREPINYQKGTKFRILTIGGSTTFGTGTKYPWAFILQAKLNSLYPEEYEVINPGLEGLTTKNMVAFLKQSKSAPLEPNDFIGANIPGANFGWLDLEPDLVLLAPVWNDISYDSRDLAYDDEIWGKITWRDVKARLSNSWLIRRTALGYYLNQLFETLYNNKVAEQVNPELATVEMTDSDEAFWAKVNFLKSEAVQVSTQRFENYLSRVVDEIKPEAQVILLGLPSLYSEGFDAPFEEVIRAAGLTEERDRKINYWEYLRVPTIEQIDDDVLSRVSQEKKIAYYNLAPTIKPYRLRQRILLFWDAIHPTRHGAQIIADQILNSLMERGIIPRPPQPLQRTARFSRPHP